ncbi:MAG: outer membrane protein transport protein [Bacteroidota bacterium]|nr:outer membrane protein transport protein [Bacteroidota bacterium]
MKKNIFSTVIIVLLTFSVSSFAQFPEDALRYSTLGTGVGARSLGLGMAYTGISNDYTALFWNPAGLGQLDMSEFSFGLSHLSSKDNSSLYGNEKSFSTSSTKLNNFGVAYPFPTTRGSMVFAAGYHRINDFAGALSFSGFNPVSSIIQNYARHGISTTKSPKGNLAWELYLANIDSLSPNSFVFDSRIQDSVTQSGKILESGGMNNWSVGGAMEAAKNLYVGMSLNINTGSYSWQRSYSEQDLDNIYRTLPFDFRSLFIDQTISATVNGFSAKFGMLYRMSDVVRIGLSFKTPSWLTIEETFTSQGESFFDNGDNFKYPYDKPSKFKTKYDVVSPFMFSSGVSYIIQDLMLTADLEYTDWTQMEFRNAPEDLISYNTDIKEMFQPTVNLRGGAEYELPAMGMRLRGGFAFLPSPYKDDPSSFARKYITAGVGFIVQDIVAFDLGYAYGFWDSFRVNYDKTSRVDEKIKTHNVVATVTYRF